MTNIVRAWSRGDQTHHGFLVKANTENGNLTEFVSSNGASSYKPVLNIIAKPINRTFRVKGLYGPSAVFPQGKINVVFLGAGLKQADVGVGDLNVGQGGTVLFELP